MMEMHATPSHAWVVMTGGIINAGYAAFSSIVYDAELWVNKTIVPDVEALFGEKRQGCHRQFTMQTSSSERT